jgi:hypothetical protein
MTEKSVIAGSVIDFTGGLSMLFLALEWLLEICNESVRRI